jgi:dynein heavy chain
VENRVEKNLKKVSKINLVHMPRDRSFTTEEFVRIQETNIKSEGNMLKGKNVEIANAVDDVIKTITTYPMDSHIDRVPRDEIEKLKKHYNNFMYQALLHCTKRSLGTIKQRVALRLSADFLYVERPIFEVDVQLSVPSVKLMPSLESIQSTLNSAAKATICVNKLLLDWDQEDLAEDQRQDFFQRVTQDIEIVRVVLLLTGSVQGMKQSVTDFLTQFKSFDWMWKVS